MKKPTPPASAKKPVSLGASGAEMEARRGQRLKTVALLKAARVPLQVVAVAEQAEVIAERAVREAMAQQPPSPPLACREGCAWCCYKTVGTAAPEVLRIAAYLRQTRSSGQLRATQARIHDLIQQRQALRPDRRSQARLPCPLLVEDRCSVYPVRPLTCRGFNSSNAHRCEESLQPGRQTVVPSYAPQQRLCTFVLDGMRAGLGEARLDGELLELTAALDIVLNMPDATERWLAGEKVFASARLP
jgi:Fe-S-cluster containining protein